MHVHATIRDLSRFLGLRAFLAALAAAALHGCAPAGERGASGPRAYLDRLGDDTVSAEAYTRTADGFEGDVLVRSPLTRVAHYRASLTPDGHVARFEVEWRVPPENPGGGPALGVTYTLEGDSATIARHGGRGSDTLRVAVPAGAIPTIGVEPYSYALLELAIRQARSSNDDSVSFVFLTAGGQTTPNAVVRLNRDTVRFDLFGDPLLVSVGPDGHIVALSGARTTAKVEGRAAPDLDLRALAADFAGRDSRGEGMGGRLAFGHGLGDAGRRHADGGVQPAREAWPRDLGRPGALERGVAHRRQRRDGLLHRPRPGDRGHSGARG